MIARIDAPEGLRVLLIRKDFKQNAREVYDYLGLRVLLIRKDFKLTVGRWLLLIV